MKKIIFTILLMLSASTISQLYAQKMARRSYGAQGEWTMTWSVKQEDGKPKPNPVRKALYRKNPTAEQRLTGYIDNPDNKTVTFVYDVTAWGVRVDDDDVVAVGGSFNGWSTGDSRFFMTRTDGGKYNENVFYYVTCPYDLVNVPGPVGLPEFNFIINGNYYMLDGFEGEINVTTNNVKSLALIDSRTDSTGLAYKLEVARHAAPLSSFNLSTEEDKMRIANFRNVAGTSKLYRSYHPYKVSLPDLDTEVKRIGCVNELMASKGIKSVISMSDDERGKNLSYEMPDGSIYNEHMSAYMRNIPETSCLFVGKEQGLTPSYYTVYYNSNTVEMREWVREVVDFIIDDSHEAPFLMHSRFGIDRTGVMSAIISALCGSTWDEIVADYERSNETGIRENRYAPMLRFSLSNMLKQDVSTVQDLQAAFTDYFVKHETISKAQIDALNKKLK